MPLNSKIISKKLFFIKKPLKFYLGIEFQRKEYCFWCNKIEDHGGIVYDTIDDNTINLTKNNESNKNDDKCLWHDCQFIDDCIKIGALIDIKNYRITKRSDVQKDNHKKPLVLTTSSSSSSPPRKKYKSFKDNLVLTDEKLKMNTAVQLEPISLPNISKNKENKTITSTNTNDDKTKQINSTPGFTKGIKVVDMETLLDSRFKLLKSPDNKSKNTKNSASKKCVNDAANDTSDKSLKQKINNKSIEESSTDGNQLEILMDNLSDDSKPLKKLSMNKNSSSRLTSVENKNCKKKMNEFGDRKLLGMKVREVPMATSSDDDENIRKTVSSYKENNKSNLKQEISSNYNFDESVIVVSSDDDDDKVDKSSSSSSINRPNKRCHFNTVYVDIGRKPK